MNLLQVIKENSYEKFKIFLLIGHYLIQEKNKKKNCIWSRVDEFKGRLGGLITKNMNKANSNQMKVIRKQFLFCFSV